MNYLEPYRIVHIKLLDWLEIKEKIELRLEIR